MPNTSTYALTNVTLPYAVAMADQGMEEAIRADPVLARGVNTYRGSLTNEAVAQAHGLEWTPVSSVIHGAAE